MLLMTCKSKLFCGLQCPWLFPLCYHTLPRFPWERISWDFLNERHKWLKWTDEIQSQNKRTAWWGHWWKYHRPLPIKVYSFPFPFLGCHVEFPEPDLMLRKDGLFLQLVPTQVLENSCHLSMLGFPCAQGGAVSSRGTRDWVWRTRGAGSPISCLSSLDARLLIRLLAFLCCPLQPLWPSVFTAVLLQCWNASEAPGGLGRILVLGGGLWGRKWEVIQWA